MHYPEKWGYLVFDGPYEFCLSRDELVKWNFGASTRQRAYYTAHGRFTSDFSLLKGDDVDHHSQD